MVTLIVPLVIMISPVLWGCSRDWRVDLNFFFAQFRCGRRVSVT